MLKIKLSTPCDSLFVIFICYMGDLISEANQQLDHCSLLFTTCFSHCLSLMLSTVNYCWLWLTTFDHFDCLLLSTAVEYCLTPLPLAAFITLHYSHSLLLSTTASYSHSHTVICLRLSSAQQYQSKSILLTTVYCCQVDFHYLWGAAPHTAVNQSCLASLSSFNVCHCLDLEKIQGLFNHINFA